MNVRTYLPWPSLFLATKWNFKKKLAKFCNSQNGIKAHTRNIQSFCYSRWHTECVVSFMTSKNFLASFQIQTQLLPSLCHPHTRTHIRKSLLILSVWTRSQISQGQWSASLTLNSDVRVDTEKHLEFGHEWIMFRKLFESDVILRPVNKLRELSIEIVKWTYLDLT